MSTLNLNRDLLKAVALGEADTIERLNEQRLASDRTAQEREAFLTLASAVLVISLEHRFKDDASIEAVKRFIDEMRYDFRDAQPPIKPLAIEVIIRAVMGEDHLLDEVSPEDQLESHFPVIRKITLQSEDMTARIDAYLDDAELLAQEWQSEA